MALCDLDCRHAKPRDKNYRLFDSGGLYLDVTKSGKKVWRLKYHFHGREKLFTIGHYPALSLVAAREKRELAKQAITEGIDPSEEKQEQKKLARCQGMAREISRHMDTQLRQAYFKPAGTECISIHGQKTNVGTYSPTDISLFANRRG